MLINLCTLDVQAVGVQVVQWWSPDLHAWICIVDKKSAQPPPDTIELTCDDMRQIVALRLEGRSREEALAAVGALDAGSKTRL